MVIVGTVGSRWLFPFRIYLTDFLCATVVASYALGLHAQAADHYPNKPVRVIVGSAAARHDFALIHRSAAEHQDPAQADRRHESSVVLNSGTFFAFGACPRDAGWV
jgi:hypothetical protein